MVMIALNPNGARGLVGTVNSSAENLDVCVRVSKSRLGISKMLTFTLSDPQQAKNWATESRMGNRLRSQAASSAKQKAGFSPANRTSLARQHCSQRNSFRQPRAAERRKFNLARSRITKRGACLVPGSGCRGR